MSRGKISCMNMREERKKVSGCWVRCARVSFVSFVFESAHSIRDGANKSTKRLAPFQFLLAFDFAFVSSSHLPALYYAPSSNSLSLSLSPSLFPPPKKTEKKTTKKTVFLHLSYYSLQSINLQNAGLSSYHGTKRLQPWSCLDLIASSSRSISVRLTL